jgi:hypothetical protein
MPPGAPQGMPLSNRHCPLGPAPAPVKEQQKSYRTRSACWHRKRLRPRSRQPGGGGSRLSKYAQTTAGLHAPAAMGLGGRHEVRQQQPRALLEDTGLQPRPTTDGSIEIPTTDAHACANGTISHLFSKLVFQVQSSLLRAPTTNLTGPVATPTPCGVICHLQPAWIK